MDSLWEKNNNPRITEYINEDINLKLDNGTETIEVDDSDATFFEPDSDNNDFNMDLSLCELNLNCNYGFKKVNDDAKKKSVEVMKVCNTDFEKMDVASCNINSNPNLQNKENIFNSDSAIDVSSSSYIVAMLDENLSKNFEINKPSTSSGLYGDDKIMTPILIVDSDDSADEDDKGVTNTCLNATGNSYNLEKDLLTVQEQDLDISCAERCLNSQKFKNKVNGIWNQCELEILNGKNCKQGRKYLMKVKNDLIWLHCIVKLYNNWTSGETLFLHREDVVKTVTRLEDTKNLLKESFKDWKAVKSPDECGWKYPSIIAEHNNLIWMMDKLKKAFIAQMKICDRKYQEEIEKLKDSINLTGSSTSSQSGVTILSEDKKENGGEPQLLNTLGTGAEKCHNPFNQPFNDLFIPSTLKNNKLNQISQLEPLECKPDSTRSESCTQIKPSILKHKLNIEQYINQSLIPTVTKKLKLMESTQTVDCSNNFVNSNDKRSFSSSLISCLGQPTKKVRFSENSTDSVQITEFSPIVNQIETTGDDSWKSIYSGIIQQNESNSMTNFEDDKANLHTTNTDRLNNVVREIDQRFQSIQVTSHQNTISNVTLGAPLFPLPFDLSLVHFRIRLPNNDVSEIEYRSMTTNEIFDEMLNSSDSDSFTESSNDDMDFLIDNIVLDENF